VSIVYYYYYYYYYDDVQVISAHQNLHCVACFHTVCCCDHKATINQSTTTELEISSLERTNKWTTQCEREEEIKGILAGAAGAGWVVLTLERVTKAATQGKLSFGSAGLPLTIMGSQSVRDVSSSGSAG